MSTDPEAVLDLWFPADLDSAAAVEERSARWFAADRAFDDLIRERFGALPDSARAGDLEAWSAAPRSALALVLCLDQFPRNLHRGSADAFAYDAAALGAARQALARDFDARLHPLEAAFLYLPFEHAEDGAAQRESVARFAKLVERAPAHLSTLFENYLSFAERHHAIVERFGRFPHRNEVLGRTSTAEEIAYLEAGGETFSGADSGK